MASPTTVTPLQDMPGAPDVPHAPDAHEMSEMHHDMHAPEMTEMHHDMHAPEMTEMHDGMHGAEMTEMHQDMHGPEMTEMHQDMHGPEMTEMHQDMHGPEMTEMHGPEMTEMHELKAEMPEIPAEMHEMHEMNEMHDMHHLAQMHQMAQMHEMNEMAAMNIVPTVSEEPPSANNNEIVVVEPQPDSGYPNKRRKKKSIVWEHFTIENIGEGCRRACCKQCKQSFAYSTGSKVAGTSHLKRHIAKGACPVVLRNQGLQGYNQSSPFTTPAGKYGAGTDSTPRRRYRTTPVQFVNFDAERCRNEVSRMIIMHDYPLHIVEHPGFVQFVQNLQPRFDMVSFNTVQGDCVATYLREKQSIQKVIETTPGRICLTLDLWSSCLTLGYVFITGYFIDSEWKMHRKLLNVVRESCPDSDTAFSHAVSACLDDWGMKGKLFSVTINQSLNDASVDNLRALLSVKNPLVLSGQLLLGNCLARSLTSIVQDALSSMQETLKKVRDSVKYVKTSDVHEEKFLTLKKQLQVPSTKNLAMDDITKWNTTYEMLLTASELKEVFSCLDTTDSEYSNAPSVEDWKKVEILCTYLKPLFETANILTTPTVPTTNTFFHEAWKVQLELARAAASDDPFVRGLTSSMQEKFDKYWRSSCFILAIAVVMDPRFKMKLVEFSFSKIYGENSASYVKIVDEGIHELFKEYVEHPGYIIEQANNGKIEGAPGDGASNGQLTDFDMYIMETNSQKSKTELDQYLEESLLPRVHEFDVIGWWKLNRTKYPTLSKMARDILSIPVCTVAADSVFDSTPKEMDSYKCSLRPETTEALICAKDWIQSGSSDNNTERGLVKVDVPI